jgi:hypothetical protein
MSTEPAADPYDVCTFSTQDVSSQEKVGNVTVFVYRDPVTATQFDQQVARFGAAGQGSTTRLTGVGDAAAIYINPGGDTAGATPLGSAWRTDGPRRHRRLH